jgi:hypothetical protein
MTDVQKLKDTIKVCMLDQYGTVVDMQGGLVKVATPFLKEKGWTGNPNSFVTWWRRTHFENSMIDALLHRERKFEPNRRCAKHRRWPSPLKALGSLFASAWALVDGRTVADGERKHLLTGAGRA